MDKPKSSENEIVPKQPDLTAKDDFGIQVCLKGAEELRKKLRVGEYDYTRIAVVHNPHPKDQYLYTVLDEVEKAGSALIRYQEMLSGEPIKEKDRIARNLVQAIVDEQMLWVRKLTEILCNLILFSKTNQEEYFRHYILVKEAEKFRKVIADFNEYFGGKNKNHAYQLDDLKNELLKLEAGPVNLSRCWYLPPKKGGGKQSGTRGRIVDFETRFSEALEFANASEKIALRFSYQTAYGHPSESLHFVGLPEEEPADESTVSLGITAVGLLAAAALIRIRRILGDRRRTGIVAGLARVEKTNRHSQEVLRRIVNRGYKVGDFVIAYGDLGEIVKIHRTKYGYRSYEVRYLSTPPLPEITSDTFPPKFVRKLYSRQELAAAVTDRIKAALPGQKVSVKEVSKVVRQAMLELWEKFGLRYWAAGRPDLMNQKINEYLEGQKLKQPEEVTTKG